MIEDNEMDGGTTFANGKRRQIVLDDKGVFLRTEEMNAAAAPKKTAMDTASAHALTQTPAAAQVPPTPPSQGASDPSPAAQGGLVPGGFKAPT